MVIATWQPEASSTHRIAAQASKVLSEPVTHTGTLDPLASGVVVLLSGEDRFAKGHLDWEKTYSFSILWGVATDSGDGMGLITDTGRSVCTELTAVLQDFPREYAQRIPDFSARRVQGSSAFSRAREKQTVSPRSRMVTLSSISVDDQQYLSADEVLRIQQQRVAAVSGDFRQAEIIDDWQQQLLTQQYLCTSHTVTTAPGFYVRQLTQDIAARVGTPACTWSITRTQNGPFMKADCIAIDELSTLQLKN